MRVAYWKPLVADCEALVSLAGKLGATEVTYHDHAQGKDCSETCWALPEEDG